MPSTILRGMLAFIVLVLFFPVLLRAQIDPSRPAPATIIGRVTDGKKPMQNVVVVLLPAYGRQSQPESVSAKTDADGRFRLVGIAPGRYEISPATPTHVAASTFDGPRGRTLMVNPGENIENVDFDLTRGGVITGRVTDSNGRPVISEMIQLNLADNSRRPVQRDFFTRRDRSEMMTDDRGVYRVYGLAPGTYRVSIGSSGRTANNRTSGTQSYYPRTFHPGTTEEAEAKLVEVTSGSEATDIDITVNRSTRETYKVTGRFVFAETSQPAPNISVTYGPIDRNGRATNFYFGGGFVGSLSTDAKGQFQLNGLASGRYGVSAFSREGSDWYSDPVIFEVADSNVEGIEVKLKRGASISGIVQLDGNVDRATGARILGQTRIMSFPDGPGDRGASFPTNQNILPDGTFRIGGLRAGSFRLGFAGDMARSLVLLRVEQNGVVLPRTTIDVPDGASVTGIRLVAAYGNAIVRGQIQVTGGALPEGWRLMVGARRVGGDGQGVGRGGEVDSRGSFILEGLVPGEYDFQPFAMATGRAITVVAPGGGGIGAGTGGGAGVVVGGGPGDGGGRGGGRGGGGGPRRNRITGTSQRVTVTDATDQLVILTLNIAETPGATPNQ